MAEGSDPFVKATTYLDSIQSVLSSETERLKVERDKMEEDFPKLRQFTEDCVSLNVGGQIFMTSLQTLRKDSNSTLASMFSGRFEMTPRKDGTFFIDRDPTHFRYILNYLRTGKITTPRDPGAREELLLEADFFNIGPLIEELTEKPGFHESTLLSEEDRTTLLSWLKNKTNWQLIYKASRDGFRAADFHRCCDEEVETVSAIHTTDGYLFGGYTDIPWTSAGGLYKQSPRSFLFAFRSSSQGNRAVKAYVVDSSKSVYHNPDYGCVFGGGNNICIADSSNINSSSYSNWESGQFYPFPSGVTANKHWLVGQQYFQTQDIEVFGHK